MQNSLFDPTDIPDIINLTQLRYKTNLLLRKLTEEKKPVILVKRSKRVGIIYPLVDSLGAKIPKHAFKIKPLPLGAPVEVDRKLIYDDYLGKKVV